MKKGKQALAGAPVFSIVPIKPTRIFVYTVSSLFAFFIFGGREVRTKTERKTDENEKVVKNIFIIL